MIINALSSVGRSHDETRNVGIAFSTLFCVILVVFSHNITLVLYLILLSFGLGVGLYLFQYYSSPPSFWVFGQLLKLKHSPYLVSARSRVKSQQCNICDKQNCKRHDGNPKLGSDLHKTIMVPALIDEKIEEFCQLLMVHYIYSWYQDISKNSDFLYDVRCIFQHVAASITRILYQLDIG